VLSIPCCTGEEPYSIFMFLRHAGLLADQIRIVAVDISRRLIEKAQRGEYHNLSFREQQPLCDVLRCRFFERASPHRVTAEVREAVTFRVDNLVSPTFLSDSGQFDVIFCRNVLIYFDGQARAAAMKTLDRLLAPRGLLFGGHAEPLTNFDARYRSVGPAGAFAYQRAEAVAPAHARKPPFPFSVSASSTPNVVAELLRNSDRSRGATPPHCGSAGNVPPNRLAAGVSSPVGRKSQAVSKSKAVPPTAEPTPPASLVLPAGDLLASAEEAANAGRLSDAHALCKQHLHRHGPTAPVFCLMGILLQAAGELAEAEKSFQKAVYLDPAHRDSLWHLTLLAERRGDRPAAEILRRRLSRIASAGGS